MICQYTYAYLLHLCLPVTLMPTCSVLSFCPHIGQSSVAVLAVSRACFSALSFRSFSSSLSIHLKNNTNCVVFRVGYTNLMLFIHGDPKCNYVRIVSYPCHIVSEHGIDYRLPVPRACSFTNYQVMTYEPPHGKTNTLHMRKQRRRSALW